MGNCGYGQFITLCVCQSFLLMLFPCSHMESLPQDTVLTTFSHMGPSHRMQFSKSFRKCPWSPTGHRFCLKTCCYTEFSLWATAPARPLCRLQLSSRHLHLLCREGHWWAQLCAMTSLSRIRVELALCDMEQFLVSFHWNHLFSPPTAKPFRYKRTAFLSP